MTTSNYMPDVQVEIAFDSGYSTPAADRTWTDVSTYVEFEHGVSISRGRGDEHSEVSPSQLSLTLDNTDGRFTAGLAAGAYYPDVKIGRPIRVRATPVGENLALNPSLETNTTGWAGSATVTRDNTRAYSGTWSAKISTTGNIAYALTGLTPNQTYTASAWVYIPSAVTGTITPRVGGTAVAAAFNGATITARDEWVRTSMTFTVDADGGSLSFFPALGGSGDRWADALMIEAGSAATDYADGDSLGWEWAGAAHASASSPATLDRFTGYIDAWPAEWDGTADRSLAKVTASSRQARLGLNNERRSAIEEEILLDGPSAYYTLGDPEGSTSAVDLSGNGADPLAPTGTGAAVVFGSATGPGADDLTAATFSGGQWLRATIPVLEPEGMGCFFTASAPPASAQAILTLSNDAAVNANALELRLNTDGKVALYSTETERAVTTTSLADGSVHHLFAAKGSGSLYVDGVLVAAGGGFVGTFGSMVLGVGGDRFGLDPLVGSVSHVAVYDGVILTADQVADISAAGLTGLDGDPSDDWIARIADWEGIPTAEQDLEAGEATITGLRTSGMTAIDAMSKVAATEGGLVLDGRDGSLVFQNRSGRYSAASALTLDMAKHHVESDYAAVLDRQQLVNEVEAGNGGDTSPVRIVDTASQADYGNARDTLELATTDAAELAAAAGWRVSTYAEPRIRVPTLSVELTSFDPVLQAAVLAADVGTRFAVINAPENGHATSADYVIEGYDEQIGPESYRLTFNVSDATIWDVFTLDDPVLGVLDAGNRLAW